MLSKSKLALALSSALISAAGLAQVITDGTMGEATNLSGPGYIVDQSLGTLSGNNLFHSFSQFDLLLDESATFTGSDTISNVISRVTGDNPSHIQGRIKSEIGTADFYFINPAGVIFGEGAKVDVPGAFYVSTAQQLNFSNGGVFSADTSANSTLSIAAPESFGFLGEHASSIVFDGSNLKIEAGDRVAFSAANINATSSEIKYRGGQLSLIATGDSDTIQSLDAPQLTGNGSINWQQSEIRLEGNGNASLVIVGSEVNTYDTKIAVKNTGDLDSQTGIEVVTENMVITNSLIRTETNNSGRAGDVLITANTLTLTSDGNTEQDESVLSSESKVRRPPPDDAPQPPDGTMPPPPPDSIDFGSSGDIKLQIADSLKILNNATISNVTQENGPGGNIDIHAGSMLVDTISATADVGITTLTSGSGQGGDLVIVIDNELQLIGNGQLNAMTLGSGNAGNIQITANSLAITGNENTPNSLARPGIRSLSGTEDDLNNAPEGNSGDIELNIAGELRIESGGEIASVTTGNGDAGNISINVGSLYLKSEDGETPITIGSNTLGPDASGDAGNIVINSDGAINLLGNAFITTLSNSAGDAGDMTINAQSLYMAGTNNERARSGINSSTTGPGSRGDAGTVIINVTEDIQMINGANITSDTENAGNAGNIFINARSLSMSAVDDSGDTGISSSATDKEIPGEEDELQEFVSSGNAANIEIRLSGDMVLIGEAEIKTEGESLGNAGNVYIEAANFYMEGGEIESKAEGEGFKAGNAGDVTMVIAGNVTITDEGAIASDSFNGGAAGNVTITAGSLDISDLGSITSTAALTRSNAGNINISVSGDMTLSEGGNIVSDSILADQAGTITISAQNLTLSGDGFPTRISSTSLLGLGTAGEINIDVVDTVLLTAGGQITSSTLGATGDAGTVNLSAGELIIDAQNQVSLDRYIEYVEDEFEDIPDEFEQLPLDDDDLIEWAAIIDIRSNELLSTGITTVSDFDAIGNAGVININVNSLTVSNGGEINSSSFATGDAGDIVIHTNNLLMNHDNDDIRSANISSKVGAQGSGAAGNITISATDTISLNGGLIAVDTGATLETDETREAGSITLTSNQFFMADNANVTSGSSGNIAAGDIDIRVSYQTALMDAQITSSAVDADAGDINLETQQFFMEDSLVTTSVSNNGNGGNIAIDADFILMEGGFIQGNTGGQDFTGGDITIGADFLIVSNQSLVSGGEERLVFTPNSGINVIQAAAPDGVSGDVNIGALEFDLSDELASIGAEVLQLDNLDNNPCNTGNASTLANTGKGGLAQQPNEYNSPILNSDAIKIRLQPNSNGALNKLSTPDEGNLKKLSQGRNAKSDIITCQVNHSDKNKEHGAP
ncbi:filamentous hemagglutinin N-terminal domain-containing protein [Planctobacterium marinum]|uniref:Filamentous haemagglutinin FhaB/tRNA nuclease CdiA-like TPS domain-containing protein n=1 Tax=Planctobacterium marinum TaxID=1631968 RepID=A0AA48HN77_9ALTE|nr:hypothetical protein MACH26_38400 [Planctobacterium marinum]